MAAFVGGEVRGLARAQQVGDQALFFLTVHGSATGNDSLQVTFRAAGDGGTSVPLAETLVFRSDAWTGGTTTSGAADQEIGLPHVAVQPNPARGATRLALDLPVSDVAAVSISDLLGREVRRIPPQLLGAGMHRLPLDVSGLPPGLYVVRATLSSSSCTTSLVVLE